MKILVFTTLFPNSKMPNHGVFVKDRIVNLSKLYDIRVIAPVPYFPKLNINKRWFAFSQIPPEEYIEGVRVYHPRYFITPKFFRSLYGIFMFLSALTFVKRLKREFDFDIIDGHFIYPDGLAAVLLARTLGVKATLTARGTDINWYPKFKIIRRQIRYALRNAASIISVSDDLKDKMIGLGARYEDMEVIPNGVDFDKFYPESKSEARSALGINETKKALLSVGNLIEAKGFQFLLMAIALIKNRDLNLFIIGEGDYKKSLEALVRNLGLGDRVKFLGEVPHRELRKWYSAADL